MIAAGLVVVGDRLDVTQASCPRELGEQQREQHVPGGKGSNTPIGTVFGDESIEPPPGEVVGYLAEDGILMWHGVSAPHVRFVGKQIKPSRMNTVSIGQENEPDSRGLAPGTNRGRVLVVVPATSAGMTI